MKITTLDKIIKIKDVEFYDGFIGMKSPWSIDQECVIIDMPQDLRFPAEIMELGYTYFLELSSVLELVELGVEHGLSNSKLVELVYFYAENDAYPDWLYEQ